MCLKCVKKDISQGWQAYTISYLANTICLNKTKVDKVIDEDLMVELFFKIF